MRPLRLPRVSGPLLGAICALAWTFSAGAGSAPIEQPFSQVFARFNSAVPQYRAFRRIEAGALDATDKQGWLEAWTEFTPQQGFRFDVVREQGSEYIRNKVLRKLLLNEQELLQHGRALRAALTPANYAFENGGSAGGLQRILLKPQRKSHGIVSGSLLIDPADEAIVRMEGRLVKSPSFFVRDVDVAWTFARIGDHLVPTAMNTQARVRFYGRSYLKMTYDYASVDGRPSESLRASTGGRE